MMRKTVFAACLTLVSACATLPEQDGGKSMVAELRNDDAAYLAETMARITRLRLGEERDYPLDVVRPDRDTVLTPAFLDHLRNAGYTVTRAPDERAGRVRYHIGPFGDAVLMRLQIADEEVAATFRRHADGTLSMDLPYSVQSARQ
jgi:hypothetical protein